MTEIPKPFGYVGDRGLPRRMFQHEPFSEMEQLMYSTAPVYSHGQMREAIAASRKQALEEAAAIAQERSGVLPHYSDLVRGYANGRSDACAAIRSLATKQNPDRTHELKRQEGKD